MHIQRSQDQCRLRKRLSESAQSTANMGVSRNLSRFCGSFEAARESPPESSQVEILQCLEDAAGAVALLRPAGTRGFTAR